MSFFTNLDIIDTDLYWYDSNAAESAVRYIENECYHAAGPLAATPLILEDWQKSQIIRPLFGWKHKKPTQVKDAQGRVVNEFKKRKFKTLHMEVPKKSGKGTLTSAIVQCMMDIDTTEPTMEVAGLAWGRDQARIVWDMVNKSMSASKRATDKFDFWKNSIVSKDGNRSYKVWTKETGSNDGKMPSVVLADEVHVHKTGDLLDMAEKSTITRANPLIMLTTTAGDNLDGVGYSRSQYAKEVAQGVRKDESILVCIYCADEKEDDIYDEEVWYKVHPMLGVSIDIDTFRGFAEKAKTSTYEENSFKRYYLNIWNNTRNQYISDRVWLDSQWDFDVKLLDGAPCYGGLDLSSTGDLTAYSLLFPVDDYFISMNWFFLPEEQTVGKIDKKRLIQYQDWVRDGLIIETPGARIDYNFVQQVIEQTSKQYKIQAIGYDAYNSEMIARNLTDSGLNMLVYRQSYSAMHFPTKELESLVVAKKFNHLGNPVLRWMNNNTSIATDPTGNIRIYKDKKDMKVDGMVANVMALGLASDPNNKAIKTYLNETGGELYII